MTNDEKRMQDRRDFLKKLGLGAAGLLAGSAAVQYMRRLSAAEAPARPNILLIISDEHNHRILGAAGNALARTPNLDSLAARGVLFENCYTNSPLCVPARLSLTSGKYCSRIGGWNNSCWIEDDNTPSIAHQLNAAGYESFLCGKMHYDPTRRYGFTEIGRDNTNESFMSGRGGRFPIEKLDGPPSDVLSTRFKPKEFGAGDNGPVERHDLRVRDGVVQFLKDRKPGAKPFFMLAGFLAPHFPLIVPEKYWQHFKDKVPMPVIPAGHLAGQPANYRMERRTFQIENVPPESVKMGRELYYGFVEWVDEQIGAILDALAASPFADNTVVFYTTDHGENMGEHGLWWKCNMYETSSRIPLIVAFPARWKGGRRRKGVCSLVDVTATCAELGGAKMPDDTDGASLVGWLDDPSAKWKDVAVSEYYAHNICSGFAMYRTGKWKYVYHSAVPDGRAGEEELYDLDADPNEFANLAKDGAHADVCRDLHARLVKQLGEEPDKTEVRSRADLAKGYGRKNSHPPPQGEDKGEGEAHPAK